MRNVQTSSYILMYAGIIPFILCTYSIVLESSFSWNPLSTEQILTTYTLLIGSFMAGVHWGQHLSDDAYRPITLAIVSNLVTLTFWFALLTSTLKIFLIISAFLFMLLLVIDFFLILNNIITRRYYLHRTIVTLAVVTNLLTSSLFITSV
ncbi:DUF3429 domain-containing protein [Curvivirga sp.]|uniref:DUF3429 domain-containing protein n=1 Tax=Curvivirga sp. TaxID=2856848 RepID=UPI003B58DEDF